MTTTSAESLLATIRTNVQPVTELLAELSAQRIRLETKIAATTAERATTRAARNRLIAERDAVTLEAGILHDRVRDETKLPAGSDPQALNASLKAERQRLIGEILEVELREARLREKYSDLTREWERLDSEYVVLRAAEYNAAYAVDDIDASPASAAA